MSSFFDIRFFVKGISLIMEPGCSNTQNTQAPNRLPKENTCSICIDTLITDPNDFRAAFRLPCFHWFHKACIAGWVRKVASCPNCRLPLGDVIYKQLASFKMKRSTVVPGTIDGYISESMERGSSDSENQNESSDSESRTSELDSDAVLEDDPQPPQPPQP